MTDDVVDSEDKEEEDDEERDVSDQGQREEVRIATDCPVRNSRKVRRDLANTSALGCQVKRDFSCREGEGGLLLVCVCVFVCANAATHTHSQKDRKTLTGMK